MRSILALLAVTAASVIAGSTPAAAALTVVRACGSSDITLGAGATFTSCAGYYSGNLFNNSSNVDIAGGLSAISAPAGIFTTYAAIPATDKLTGLNGQTVINFGETLYGDTIVGVHFGAGQGSPGRGFGPPNRQGNPTNVDTSVFYRFNAGTAGINSFTLNFNASSNATLFVTGNAVPEPATWAMMLGGFGLLGAASRRRARTIVTYA
jgi:hypothetical protein